MKNMINFDKMYEYETGFNLTSGPERFGKLLTHYEVYKKIINLPGEIIECGVFRGTSITRFATFRRMFETDSSRKIIGFDNFNDVYPDTGYEEDQEQRLKWMATAGSDSITVEQLENVFNHREFKNYQFIQGDLTETLPMFIEENPQLKVSLLNIDIDFVEPTYCSLNLLFDRVVDGGIILFDNYGAFHGDTKGIDMFFEERGLLKKFKKLSFNSRPVFYVKEKTQ